MHSVNHWPVGSPVHPYARAPDAYACTACESRISRLLVSDERQVLRSQLTRRRRQTPHLDENTLL